jgi:hypothetical protein
MVSKLAKLYNTLLLIETKGENTKIMSQCLQYMEQLIAEEKASESTGEKEVAIE